MLADVKITDYDKTHFKNKTLQILPNNWIRILERCLLKRENWNGRSNAQFYTTIHPHTMGLLSSREGVIFISANVISLGLVPSYEN
jgi:hypothetical protein